MAQKHIFIAALIALVSSCGGTTNQHIRENPFLNGDAEPLSINITSNADTVRLNWSLQGEIDFDQYRIRIKDLGIERTVSRNETQCILTHVSTYNAPVKCDVSLIKGSDALTTQTLYLNIDGLDASFLRNLMPDDGSSVCAGDGVYSIGLPDGRSVFLMGDSFICPVNGVSRSPYAHMYRNTYIVFDPRTKSVSPIYDFNGKGTNSSAAVPPGHYSEDKWYWPGHGFVAGNSLYVFQSLMYLAGAGMWGFAYENSNLLKYSLPDLKLQKDAPIQFRSDKEIHYGAAAFNNGDYIYIYAQVDITNDLDAKTEVYCARALEADLYGVWEYWNGTTWVKDSAAATGLTGLSSVSVSSQFNVFKLKDKYVLLTKSKKLWEGEIYTFTSSNPQGPWGHKKVIYKVPAFTDSNLMSYNAMAHPQFEKDGMILVSYCMNTSDGDQQARDVTTYRPRFFWVDINDILN